MKTLIFKSKNNIFEVIESEGSLQINKAPGIPLENQNSLIVANGGHDAFLAKCQYSDKPYSELYAEREAQVEKSKEINARAKAERLSNLWDAAPQERSAKGMYDLFKEINKLDPDGWKVVQFFFLQKNPLSDVLRAKLGNYTATPYDNGEVIIKANGVSYSNHRHHTRKPISDLI